MKRATAVMLLCALPLAAQMPYVESVEVRVHNLDVVVTDAKGNPVTGLTRDDFEVLEDGKPQTISNFSAYTESAGAAPRGAAAASGAAEGATAETPVAPPPRKFIFYVDQMSLTQQTQTKLKAQLDRLMRETWREGDEGMIVRPHEARKLKMPFTGDRDAVRDVLMKALQGEKWRATTPIYAAQHQIEVSMKGMMSMMAQRHDARRYAKTARKRVQQRLGELRAVVTAAADVPGRKILVLATESLPLEPGREAFSAAIGDVGNSSEEGNPAFGDWTMLEASEEKHDWINLRPLVDEIARTAATGGITIHAVQAEYGIGLLAPGGAIDGPTPGRGSWDGDTASRRTASKRIAGTNPNYAAVEMMASSTEATLRTLAEKTGGTWHRGAFSFDNLVEAVAQDVSSYYSIAYRAMGDYDRPHRIDVRVKGRPDLKVRARREVLRKSPDRELTDRVVASLLADLPPGDIPLRVESKDVAKNRKAQTVAASTHIPLSALTFIPDGDKLKASFSVHYAVAGETSVFVSGVHGTQVVEIRPEELESTKAKEWTYVIPMTDMPRQRYTVAIGVIDTVSRQTGFARVELQ